jgi:branched-subunit amino acid permease
MRIFRHKAVPSPKVSLLHKFFEMTSSTSAKAVMIVLGFVIGNWALNNLYKIAWPWLYVGFPPVMLGVSLFVWFRVRHHIKVYRYLLLLAVSWIVSLSIGNITGGLVQAVEGLLPYYSNPYVLAYWIDYFATLCLLVFAQARIDRLMVHARDKMVSSRRYKL